MYIVEYYGAWENIPVAVLDIVDFQSSLADGVRNMERSKVLNFEPYEIN